ncbi:MAG: FAD-binding oxidoreductase [Woeseiaceae bacterium]
MQRRSFCKHSLAVAVAATLSGCGTDATSSLIPAVSSSGGELSIESAVVSEFAAELNGTVFLQSDEGYAAAKQVWNGMFDHKQPAMVVQCLSTNDVVSAVNFARDQDLLLSVKCGGHSMPGKSTSDGGLMIDLSRMQSVDVDTDAMRMRADGGSLLGHLDTASSARNTITTTGIVSHTGVGGFTLGGGVGRTDRSTGLAVDNLLAATVVTASGDVLQASAEENPDLFWGLRGGGGNFGVVTEFVYQLHSFNPTVYGGTIFYEATAESLEFYAELHETMPDEANIEPQFVPGEDGKPVMLIEVVWNGDHATGEKVLAPMLAFPGLIRGEFAPFPYKQIQTSADAMTAHGLQAYLKSSFLKELTPEVIEIMLHYVWEGKPTWSWFQHMGGASSRIAPDATAFVHRDVAFNFGIMYASRDPSMNDAGRIAVREYYKAMEPHFAGFYTNLNEDSEQKTWGNFGANYPRLVELKNKYDPDNLFRLNANIKPG